MHVLCTTFVLLKQNVSLDNILHSIQHALKCITAIADFLAPVSKANYDKQKHNSVEVSTLKIGTALEFIKFDGFYFHAIGQLKDKST